MARRRVSARVIRMTSASEPPAMSSAHAHSASYLCQLSFCRVLNVHNQLPACCRSRPGTPYKPKELYNEPSPTIVYAVHISLAKALLKGTTRTVLSVTDKDIQEAVHGQRLK